MINKSESNSKANKNNNNLSQKWNKITEIKNIKRNIISNKKEMPKTNTSSIVNKNYNTSKYQIIKNDKKQEINPSQKNNNNNTYAYAYSNKTDKSNTSRHVIDINKNENKIKNNTQNNFGINKPYKTLTYNSSTKENFNSGKNGTSIIITSSKVDEDNNDPLNKGKIHHMVTVRTFKNNENNNRSNSTSKNNKTLNTSNNRKNRSITIISSNEDIEIEKDGDNIGRKKVSNFNLRNKNNLKNENNKFVNKYIKTEPNENKKIENEIKENKEGNKIIGRNYISSALNSNASNERKNYFSNNNDKVIVSNTTKKSDDNNLKYINKLSSSEMKKNINRVNIRGDKNSLNNSITKNNINTNANSNTNTVFISSYTSKRKKDINNEQIKNNNNNKDNTGLYNSNNFTNNKIEAKLENQINKETKEIKDISKLTNISLTNNRKNSYKDKNTVNISSNKIEPKKEKNNEIEINDLKDETKNSEIKEIKENIIKPENIADINLIINKEEPKINKDINYNNNNENNNNNNKLEEDIDININSFNESKLDYLNLLSHTNDINLSNLFKNKMNLSSLNNAVEYDFLNNPELSDFTKEYLASHTSGLRPELNAYTKAYLNNLSNDDNVTKPELTNLTKEYLSKNFDKNEKI